MRLAAIFLILAAFAAAQPPRSYPSIGTIHREDPALNALIPSDAKVEVLASGFEWAEGPVWDAKNTRLLFSDIPRNSIYAWTPEKGIDLFMKPSGYTGVADYGLEPGSNGLTFDKQGRLILCEHGDRRIARLEPSGGKFTLADRYQGKRINSPNDAVVHSSGDIYFTDPIYGLPQREKDLSRELDFCGVYRWSARDGSVTLLTKELTRPNGIAFSPDEKTLYVANSDPSRALWMAYPVQAGGTIGQGRVFADVTEMVKDLPGLPDGMKVDRVGNVWATGPGGVHIMTAAGKLLGRIEIGEAAANVAFGDDGTMLYITADMYLCRVKTKSKGW
ncbi:MAG TPA: SMP-30/gluconolactonase/LRE family protein [Bryobacteraceae bacterium]|nr:SMP-30/gluconolactonase/LRE family protein [Bryobacteraceae bacterium]HPT27062.1 SMP-30/gluconolactonase/LRE family protein [Bryobacteraceae bacterium]